MSRCASQKSPYYAPTGWFTARLAGGEELEAKACPAPAVSENVTGPAPRSAISVCGFDGELLGTIKRLPGRVFIPRCAQNLKKFILRQNWQCSVIVHTSE
jgi:hypothetical protein